MMSEITLYPLVVVASRMNLKTFDLSAMFRVTVLLRIVGLLFKAVSISILIGPFAPLSR